MDLRRLSCRGICTEMLLRSAACHNRGTWTPSMPAMGAGEAKRASPCKGMVGPVVASYVDSHGKYLWYREWKWGKQITKQYKERGVTVSEQTLVQKGPGRVAGHGCWLWCCVPGMPGCQGEGFFIMCFMLCYIFRYSQKFLEYYAKILAFEKRMVLLGRDKESKIHN